MSLTGSICALATLFRERDEALDIDACRRLADHQIRAGTSALVVAGSTGEAAALDDAEFAALLEAISAQVAGRVPVLAGTGLSGTRRTIRQTRIAQDSGVDIALVVTPPYVRATQEGLYRHFTEVAEHGGLPIVLYNVPSRTACDMTPDTVARLCSHEQIIGIKEALPDPARMAALLALRSAGFSVLSGDDPTARDAMRAGADGLVSVAANVAPALVAEWIDASRSADQAASRPMAAQLTLLFEVLALEPNPIPLKWCLARLGFGSAQLRLPLLELSARHHAAAEAALLSLGLVERSRALG